MNKLKNIGKVYVASPLNAPTKKEIFFMQSRKKKQNVAIRTENLVGL